MRLGFVLAAVTLGLCAPADAQRRWTLLGQRELAESGGRDVIAVRGERRFAEVRICAANRAVAFGDVEVRFADGGEQAFRLRSVIAADSCTGALRLRGEARAIERVVFAHRGRPGARVRLYGR